MNRISRRVFLITIFIMLALSAFAWMQIPDDALIATHWGIDGKADGFSTKLFALFLMPVTSAVIFLVFLVVPVMEPRKENLILSMKFYNVISIGILLIMALTHGIILLHAFDCSFD